jgi:hypothetical protein
MAWTWDAILEAIVAVNDFAKILLLKPGDDAAGEEERGQAVPRSR